MSGYFAAVGKVLTAGVLMAATGFAVAQQSYPAKPIRFITPYAPGGTTDILARVVGRKLAERWNQPVIIDNRPGGDSIIGSDALAKSPPDGYTIMLTSGSHVIIPQLHHDVPFDAIKDFAPVATISSTEQLLVLNAAVQVNNLKELIALAKAKPGQLNYASSGSGGIPHVGMELFSMMSGIKMQHIPYKGAGPALTDLISGQVQMFLAIPLPAIPHVKSGKLKGIAVSGDTRLSSLPGVPTFTQAGLADFDVKTWYVVFAPARTPTTIIDKLSNEIAKIVSMPDFTEMLVNRGMEPFLSTPEQLARLMKSDMARFARVIKAANIRIEQ